MKEEFINYYRSLLKDEFIQFIAALKSEPIHAVRINPLKVDRNFLSYLEAIPEIETGYYFNKNEHSLGKSPFHDCGLYYIQDASAMLVAKIASELPGNTILDLCAAPGGKSTYVATNCSDSLVVANDVNESRVKVLSSNIERMGISNCIVTNSTIEKLTHTLPNFFDKIIIDAPCSGEGMFRKDKEAVMTWSLEKVKELSIIQKNILDNAYIALKPNGFIIYSTCTFQVAENENNIEYMLKKYNMRLVTIPKSATMSDGINMPEAVRLWPHKFKGEGHFVAVLQKNISDEIDKQNNIQLITSNINKKNLKIYRDFEEKYLTIKLNGIFINNAEHIYLSIENSPNLSNIKVLRQGLHLGSIKKDRFIPSHALALFLKKEDFKKSYNFSKTSLEIKKFLHGETLEGSSDSGYCLICCDNYPIGIGYQTGGTIKNFYPKGLRKKV